MALFGHKTDMIFRRYAIVKSSDLKSAGTKRAAYVDAPDESRKVSAQ
jgi:hypothetical protein